MHYQKSLFRAKIVFATLQYCIAPWPNTVTYLTLGHFVLGIELCYFDLFLHSIVILESTLSLTLTNPCIRIHLIVRFRIIPYLKFSCHLDLFIYNWYYKNILSNENKTSKNYKSAITNWILCLFWFSQLSTATYWTQNLHVLKWFASNFE